MSSEPGKAMTLVPRDDEIEAMIHASNEPGVLDRPGGREAA